MLKLWGIHSTLDRGFALPTVIITSVAMMIVLLAGLTATTSITANIEEQHTQQLANNAARAGAIMAELCIERGEANWTGSNKLRPGDSCSGSSASCTTCDASDYVLYDTANNQRTRFEVDPVSVTGSEYIIKVLGYHERLRDSTSTVASSTSSNVVSKYTIDETALAAYSDSGVAQVCALLDTPGEPNNRAYCWAKNDDGRSGGGHFGTGDAYCDSLGGTVYIQREVDGACEPHIEQVVRDETGNIEFDPSGSTSRSRQLLDHELDIGSGNGFACAISTNAAETISSNRVFCWGTDANRSLGQGGKVNNVGSENCQYGNSFYNDCSTPAQVDDQWRTVDGMYPVDIELGSSFACVHVKYAYTDATGKIWCWGRNNKGQHGTNSTSNGVATPVKVRNSTGAAGTSLDAKLVDTSAGATICAIDASDRVLCWGENDFGQAGSGPGVDVRVPQFITEQGTGTQLTVKDISTNSYSNPYDAGHSCGIGKNASNGIVEDKIYCWGRNAFGEQGLGWVGSGTYPNARMITTIYNADNTTGTTDYQAIDVTTASSSTCATIRVPASTGETKIYCWGAHTTLGVGDVTAACSSGSPDPYNTYLNITCGTNPPWSGMRVRNVPAPVKWDGPAPTSLVGGGIRYCMIVGSSNYCWGNNGTGQIGDRTTIDRREPTLSIFLEEASARTYF